MKKLLSPLLIIMLLMTLSSFISTDSYKFLFTQFSGIGLTNIIQPNPYIVSSLFIVFAGISIATLRSKIKIPVLFLVFSIWFLSGRVIAQICCPEEKIISGWFLIKTHKQIICNGSQDIDCETVIYYETYIEKLPFWRIRIKNTQQDISFFTGPLIYQQALEMLGDKYRYHLPRVKDELP